MNAKIVLGMQFGDEGKGLVTDYLCYNSHNPIVIRFSGGQQAGHTVMRDGIKHIHSNYGSGTLQGVPSYFSEHTCIYPNTIVREKKVLWEKGINPRLYVHPLTKVTTPYDVAYNRVTERRNGHGSCGLGIAATFKRNLETGYKLHAIDFQYPRIAVAKLEAIKEYYHKIVPYELFSEYVDIYTPEQLQYYDNIRGMVPNFFEIKDYNYLNKYDNLIFEGSQGIMLDMNHGVFPNVTFANTTSKNALEICDKIDMVDTIDTFYVTRCYQTRHGAGWMSPTKEITLVNNHEEINVFNEWQKEFKVSEIDYNLLNHSLRIDNIYNPYRKNLVVTCLDQRPGFEFDYSKIDAANKFFGTYECTSPESRSIQSVCVVL